MVLLSAQSHQSTTLPKGPIRQVQSQSPGSQDSKSQLPHCGHLVDTWTSLMAGYACLVFIYKTKCQPPRIPLHFYLLPPLILAVSLALTESESLENSSGVMGCLLSSFYPLGCTGRLPLLLSISMEPSKVKCQSLSFPLFLILTTYAG